MRISEMFKRKDKRILCSVCQSNTLLSTKESPGVCSSCLDLVVENAGLSKDNKQSIELVEKVIARMERNADKR